MKNMFANMVNVCLIQCAMLVTPVTKRFVPQVIQCAFVTQMITIALILPPLAIKFCQNQINIGDFIDCDQKDLLRR